MKKIIILVCVVSVLTAFMVVPSFAAASWNSTHGYPYLVYDGSIINFAAELASGLSLETVCVLNASQNSLSYDYQAVISYDDLSDLVLSANNHGVICSLYKNERAGYWVAYVTDYDTQWIPLSDPGRVYGCLGSVDGYVYVAEIDTTAEDQLDWTIIIADYLYDVKYDLTQISGYIRALYGDLRDIWQYTDQMNTAVQSLSEKIDSVVSNTSSALDHLALLPDINTYTANIGTKLDTLNTTIDTQFSFDGEETLLYMVRSIATKASTIATKVTTVATNSTSIKNALTGASTSGTLAYNVAQLVTLFENFDSVTVDNVTIDSAVFDTSTMETHLAAIKTATNNIASVGFNVQGGMITQIRQYLYSINGTCSDIVGYLQTFEKQLSPDYIDLYENTLASYIVRTCEATESMMESNELYLDETVWELGKITDIYLENMSGNQLVWEEWQKTKFDDLISVSSDISAKLDDLTETSVENITNLTITNDNDAYEVFYLIDENGNEESIAEFGGNVLAAGGKLLNFFFRVAFDDALSSVDSTVDGMSDFYFDSVAIGEGESIWE